MSNVYIQYTLLMIRYASGTRYGLRSRSEWSLAPPSAAMIPWGPSHASRSALICFDGLHEPAIFEYCVVTRPTRRAYGGINEEVERVHESDSQNRGPALVIAVVDRRVLVVGPIRDVTPSTAMATFGTPLRAANSDLIESSMGALGGVFGMYMGRSTSMAPSINSFTYFCTVLSPRDAQSAAAYHPLPCAN